MVITKGFLFTPGSKIGVSVGSSSGKASFVKDRQPCHFLEQLKLKGPQRHRLHGSGKSIIAAVSIFDPL